MSILLITIVVMLILLSLALVFGQLGLRKHRGVSREEFIRAFSADIPKEIPAAVYDYYKKGIIFGQFSISPDDSYDVFPKCEEDIEDDARFLMKKLNLRRPSESIQQEWLERSLSARTAVQATPTFSVDSSNILQPIRTVREMVLWLNWVREKQKTL